ncbi:hypothetical protein CN446_14950 [Bacillus cereus]|nr:hypothetical protein CN446_14950 [Bacillus cereus]
MKNKFKKNDRVAYSQNGVSGIGNVDHYEENRVWCIFDGSKTLSWMYEQELILVKESAEGD